MNRSIVGLVASIGLVYACGSSPTTQQAGSTSSSVSSSSTSGVGGSSGTEASVSSSNGSGGMGGANQGGGGAAGAGGVAGNAGSGGSTGIGGSGGASSSGTGGAGGAGGMGGSGQGGSGGSAPLPMCSMPLEPGTVDVSCIEPFSNDFTGVCYFTDADGDRMTCAGQICPPFIACSYIVPVGVDVPGDVTAVYTKEGENAPSCKLECPVFLKQNDMNPFYFTTKALEFEDAASMSSVIPASIVPPNQDPDFACAAPPTPQDPLSPYPLKLVFSTPFTPTCVSY